MSFSGLKTAVLTAVGKGCHEPAAVARAFEEAVTDTLVEKTRRALEASGAPALVVAGGVAANRPLRAGLRAMAEANGVPAFFPRPAFCTDNGAMIALAGLRRLQAGASEPGLAISARARWPLAELRLGLPGSAAA